MNTYVYVSNFLFILRKENIKHTHLLVYNEKIIATVIFVPFEFKYFTKLKIHSIH